VLVPPQTHQVVSARAPFAVAGLHLWGQHGINALGVSSVGGYLEGVLACAHSLWWWLCISAPGVV
jgi:hypothetical protein